MNIYTIYSDSHEEMLLRYLLPSLPSGYGRSITVKKVNQYCASGSFYSSGWADMCREKVIYFLDICKREMGNTFLFTDADVQFFSDPIEPLLIELGDFDIACQDDIHQFCSGLFVCRANDATLALFHAILEGYENEDQFTLNKYLHLVNHKKLSHRFFNVAHSIGGPWSGSDFNIPEDIIAHHANWTVGVENKIKLLDLVRVKYDLLRK